MKITLNIPTTIENDNQLNEIQKEVDRARRELHEAMKRKGPKAKVGGTYRSPSGRLWVMISEGAQSATGAYVSMLCISAARDGENTYWRQGNTLSLFSHVGLLPEDWTEIKIQMTVDIPHTTAT